VRRHTPVAAWLSPYVGWRTRQPLGLVGIRTLWAAVKRSHLVHIHGIWSPVGAIAALAAACNQIPYVLTPHGMLQPWLLRRGRRRLKGIHLRTVGLRVLRGAAVVHCVTASEASWVRRLTRGCVRTFVIPNPVPPDWPLGHAEQVLDAQRERVVLFVGRLHPVKGLVSLLDAWVRVWPSHREWRLLLVGHDQAGIWKELSRPLAAMDANQAVEFLGPRGRAALVELYDSAAIFVLPSFTEVIGIANLEAAARGVPILTSCRTGLDAVTEYEAGFVVRPTSARIAEALAALMAMKDADRRGKGARALQMVWDRITWEKIAPAFEDLYGTALQERVRDVREPRAP